MNKKLFYWSGIGFVISEFLGTLLHFAYQWASNSLFLAPFSAVNESTWEHMKILFFPLFVFSLIQAKYFKEYKSYWKIKFIGTTLGVLTIPLSFYTFNGAIGAPSAVINILIFFASTAVTYIFEYIHFNSISNEQKSMIPYLILLIIIAAIFALFTFYPPHIPLFQDPITQKYGNFSTLS